MTEPEFISETDASTVLSIAVNTLRFWRCRGKGPVYYKVGRSVRYTREDCIAFMKSCAVQPR